MTSRRRTRGWRKLERVGPARIAFDQDWRAVEYCVVDFETTGLDLRNDEIVSYGAVLVVGGRVVVSTSVYGLVQPTAPVPPRSVAVHTLRRDDLADAPPVTACAEAILELLRGRFLVAHAAWIEEALVDRLFRSRGARLTGPAVDTAALARATGVAPADAALEPSLEGLTVGLGLPVHTPHHALGDALTTAQLLIALATRLERSGQVRTAGDLLAASQSQRR